MSHAYLRQARLAFQIGLERWDASRRVGLVNPRDCHRIMHARQADGYAALAEWTVAERLGRAWTGRDFIGRKDEGEDVAGGIQVKWTYRRNGRLVIQADDPPDLVYVLVVGTDVPLAIKGWATFADVAQRRYWWPHVSYPAFFGPQRILRCLETLP